jgi:hypothetical protein
MAGAGVGAFAVDSARGGYDDALDAVTGLLGEPIIEQRGSGEVDLLVFCDLVHGLAGAGLGGEVDDDLMTGQRGGPDALIAHIAADEANGGLEIRRELVIAAVDLRAEAVEECDGVAFEEESSRQMGSDKTSATGDEYVQKKASCEERTV